MKNHSSKFKLVTFIFLFFGLFSIQPAKSQVSVNINIGSQMLWGPVGYDYVEYYYLPEIDVFYYVPTGQYIYWQGNQQVFVTYLPAFYHVDLYNTYKVVVNEQKPYLQHNLYITKYAKYKHGGPRQSVIRDSNDDKYYVVKGHPKHGNDGGNGGNKGRESNDGSNNKSHNDQKSSENKQERQQPKQQQQQQPKQQQQRTQPKQQSSPQHQNEHQSGGKQQNGGGGQKGKGH